MEFNRRLNIVNRGEPDPSAAHVYSRVANGTGSTYSYICRGIFAVTGLRTQIYAVLARLNSLG